MKKDSGQSLVEFALLAPMLVFLIFASVYLSDLVMARLRTHEIARYAAFAMAKQPLTDYTAPQGSNTASAHAALFTAAQNRVSSATSALYANMDSLVTSPVHHVSLDGTLGPITITHHATPGFPGASLSDLASTLGGGIVTQFIVGLLSGIINDILAHEVSGLGFNGLGMVKVQVESDWTNHFLPSILANLSGHANLAAVHLTDSVMLLADPWGLGDGSDVRTPGYIGRDPGQPRDEAQMHNEVRRMFFLKGAIPSQATSVLSVFQTIAAIAGGDPPGFGPLDAKVASFSYRPDPSNAGNDSLGKQNVFDVNGVHSGDGVRIFDTTQMRDHFNGTSPNVDNYQHRGNHFMGCPQAQAASCAY